MYRQSPTSRNHRSKGSKLKHILKFCLLLAVCFWLIYQVKHSYDKKKEFDENDTKTTLQGQIRNDFVTIGRRSLNPRLKETKTNNEKHDEGPEDEDPTLEVEENKNEDDEPEDEKLSENENGDDEIIENIQDKTDSEINGEEDFIDNENETEEKDLDDVIGRTEMGNSSEQKNQDGDDRETREENYKADDASSAVTHNIQMGTTGKEDEDGEIAKDKSWSNITTKESTLDKSLNGSLSLNDTDTKGFDEVATGNHDLSLQNLTELENNTFVTNSTGHAEIGDAELNSTSSKGTESSLLKKFREEDSFEGGNHTESSAKENGRIHIERLGVIDNDEVLASEMMENPEEDIQHDSIDLSDDSSDSLEEKDVRLDLNTLPEI